MPNPLRDWCIELIEALRQEMHKLERQISDAERERKGQVDQWATKDEIAHLSFWLTVFLQNLIALRTAGHLTSTKDYRAMNNQSWHGFQNKPWCEVSADLETTLQQLTAEVARRSDDELTSSNPRPLVRQVVYEVVEHPMHHIAGLYRKLGMASMISACLLRWELALRRPGVSAWTASARRKIGKQRRT